MVTHNTAGGFRFLGEVGRPFSGGAVADDGLDLVHATFERPIPIDAGLQAAARHVTAAGRPVQSLAGFELRIPHALTREGFDDFNRTYVTSLRALGIEVGGLIPSARTNVAAHGVMVAEPSLVAFSYTAASRRPRAGFVMSGVAESAPGSLPAMLDSIMGELSSRMRDLGVAWEDATVLQLYCVDNVQDLVVERVINRAGRAAMRGIHWFPSVPPIVDLRLEIDVRSAGTELVVTA